MEEASGRGPRRRHSCETKTQSETPSTPRRTRPRHAPTPSETALWRLVSDRKLGVTFRRQVPVAGRYIADFLAPSTRLVLEVDGAYRRDRTQADRRRDRVLARLGTRVLRLEARLVLHEPALVIARIQAALTGG